MRSLAAAAGITIAVLLWHAHPAGRDQVDTWTRYIDPQQRFEFTYPAAFGNPERGTDSGYGHRVVSLRFSRLVGLGGEIVLTTGPVAVDVQVLGGLYDAITRDLVPPADLQILMKALPPLTAASFCGSLASADHVTGLSLPPRLEGMARKLDAMRNGTPLVHRCSVASGVVVFHKEATFETGTMSARQHLYGAVRFLQPPYSSFQIVRGSMTAPTGGDIDTLERIVRSLVVR
jgi:hypothetical protein